MCPVTTLYLEEAAALSGSDSSTVNEDGFCYQHKLGQLHLTNEPKMVMT